MVGCASAARAAIRRMLHRDWFPIDEAVDVQSAVAGTNAMYCALAWQGRLVGGFAGVPLATASESGPSTAVRLGPHLGMAEASRQLLAAMGATGFIGFDFILDQETGRPLLLECNPRPIQVCHLGHRVGVDLGKALAATMAGQTAPEMSATGFAEVVLFPHAFVRAAHPAAYYDIPADDVGLRRFASQQSEP